MNNQYKNILNHIDCRMCRYRNVCFLHKIPLSSYPEQVQEFVIKLFQNSFCYQEYMGFWYTNYWTAQEQLIYYYDIHNCELKGNKKFPLTSEAQRENDRQKIRELFKQMLDMAAKANENINPEVSIMFDGIGLLLASDYVEAINKIFSMWKTAVKNSDYISKGRLMY